MFASWSKARRASLVAAAAVAVSLLGSPSVQALEGIQGRHAIFYPSLELVYQHDDNYFLLPSNEVSADTVIVHPHFALEVPGSRQYLRLEYHPQYRSVDVNRGGSDPIPDDIQHFWELDARLRGSSVFSVDIHQDFRVANIELQTLDDNRELVKGAEQFWTHDLDVDFNWEGSRQGATLGVGRKDSAFDDINEAPSWFELGQTSFGAEYFYKFTPLTRFLVGFDWSTANQDLTDRLANRAGNLRTVDSDRAELYFGFRGELGRTTTGEARLGFASLDFDQVSHAQSDFDGLTLDAKVTKSFSRYSKLIFGAQRNVNRSGYSEGSNDPATGADLWNTYYVSNRVAFTFSNQPQGGRVGWTLAGAFQRNNYDTPTPGGSGGGDSDREDDITHLRAEVGFHPLEHLSFRLNYRFEERESTHNAFDYTDNIVIFQVQFGF